MLEKSEEETPEVCVSPCPLSLSQQSAKRQECFPGIREGVTGGLSLAAPSLGVRTELCASLLQSSASSNAQGVGFPACGTPESPPPQPPEGSSHCHAVLKSHSDGLRRHVWFSLITAELSHCAEMYIQLVVLLCTETILCRVPCSPRDSRLRGGSAG